MIEVKAAIIGFTVAVITTSAILFGACSDPVDATGVSPAVYYIH